MTPHSDLNVARLAERWRAESLPESPHAALEARLLAAFDQRKPRRARRWPLMLALAAGLCAVAFTLPRMLSLPGVNTAPTLAAEAPFPPPMSHAAARADLSGIDRALQQARTQSAGGDAAAAALEASLWHARGQAIAALDDGLAKTSIDPLPI